jgi:hypothetical protein
MKLIWKPALFFVFCLLVTLLINMPVGHLISKIEMPAGVKMSQLQGSLSQGRAASLVVNQFIIQDLEYTFDISCLITLGLCYRLEFEDGSALIRYAPINGSIKVSQADIAISMNNLMTVSDQLLVKPAGSLQLRSDNLKFIAGKLADIDATVVWKNAGIQGEDIDLGSYQLDITKDKGSFQISLTDNEAVLDVKGDGDLKPDGRYTLNIDIKSRSGLEPRIKSALEFVTTKKGLNQYQIRRSGTSDKRLLTYLSFENS